MIVKKVQLLVQVNRVKKVEKTAPGYLLHFTMNFILKCILNFTIIEEVEIPIGSVEVTGGGGVLQNDFEDSSEAAGGETIVDQSSKPSSDSLDRAEHQPLLRPSQR